MTTALCLAPALGPDVRWDNGTTMLMWADPEAARILIHHGADPNARAPDGKTPLHYASSGDIARVLVKASADIDSLASPGGGKSETDAVYTPLQSALMLGDLRGVDLPRTLLELGADPMKRDGEGFPTLAYATSVPSFELMEPYGLNPLERMPDGGTLLHRLYRQKAAIRANFPQEVAILDLLLSRGIDINALDDAGQTVLHVAAPGAIDLAAVLRSLYLATSLVASDFHFERSAKSPTVHAWLWLASSTRRSGLFGIFRKLTQDDDLGCRDSHWRNAEFYVRVADCTSTRCRE